MGCKAPASLRVAPPVEVTITTDINTCGTDGFWLWMSPGDSHYVQDTNEMDRIYVLDVDGDRLHVRGKVLNADDARGPSRT